jgi:hypothetical protein
MSNPALTGLFFLSIAFASAVPTISAAEEEIPPCMSDHKPIPVNNKEVLVWKTSTPNQFKHRSYVSGTVLQAYPDHSGHQHFQLQIGPNPKKDTIEVIYNRDFGDAPEPYEGMQVSACGDYITATKKSPHGPASPDGAIIHWVHMNPDNKGHPHGFMVMDGELIGYDHSVAEPF